MTGEQPAGVDDEPDGSTSGDPGAHRSRGTVDPDDVIARARAAVHRAEVLEDLAREACIHAMVTQAHRSLVMPSPVVEARLTAQLCGEGQSLSLDPLR